MVCLESSGESRCGWVIWQFWFYFLKLGTDFHGGCSIFLPNSGVHLFFSAVVPFIPSLVCPALVLCVPTKDSFPLLTILVIPGPSTWCYFQISQKAYFRYTNELETTSPSRKYFYFLIQGLK